MESNQGVSSEDRTDARDDSGVDSAASGSGGSERPVEPNLGKSSRQFKKPESDAGTKSSAENGSTAGTGSSKSPRTRTGATSTGRAQKKTGSQKLDLNAESRKALAKQVCGVHALIGIAIGNPQALLISQEQGEQLTNSVLDVLAFYDMSVSPAMAAWSNLAAVVSMIYGPKFLLLYKSQKTASRATVSPISPKTDAPKTSETAYNFNTFADL